LASHDWSLRIRLTRRTAGCGPACPVVWQGRAGNRAPYADCTYCPLAAFSLPLVASRRTRQPRLHSVNLAPPSCQVPPGSTALDSAQTPDRGHSDPFSALRSRCRSGRSRGRSRSCRCRRRAGVLRPGTAGRQTLLLSLLHIHGAILLFAVMRLRRPPGVGGAAARCEDYANGCGSKYVREIHVMDFRLMGVI
jgi:hypothetical protein